MKEFTIAVMVEGQLLKAVSDGTEEGTTLTGSDEHIRLVKKAIRNGRLVDIAGTRRSPAIKSGYDNPLALTAALFSILSRYTSIWSAPQEVIDFIQLHVANDCHGQFSIEDM